MKTGAAGVGWRWWEYPILLLKFPHELGAIGRDELMLARVPSADCRTLRRASAVFGQVIDSPGDELHDAQGCRKAA